MVEQAAYFLEDVEQQLLNSQPQSKALIENLCYFSLRTKGFVETNNTAFSSEWGVLKNMLKRGLPTRMSLFLERCFARTFGHTEQIDDLGAIRFNWSGSIQIDDIFQQLHIIEPRFRGINNYDQTGLAENSHWEREFVAKLSIQQPYLLQLLEKQRFLTSIVKETKQSWVDFFLQKQEDFFLQRVDFSIEFPHNGAGHKGIVVEIDGSQHGLEPQRKLDEKRNAAIAENNWKWLRLKHYIANDAETKFRDFLNYCQETPFLINTKANFDNQIFDKTRLQALQIALSPAAIARLQFVVLDFLQKNILDINADLWNLAIIERDVPCAVWAVLDLMQQIKNLFLLKGESIALPKINLQVFYTPEFAEADINKSNAPINEELKKLQIEVSILPLSKFANQRFDAVVDISVLMRETVEINHLLDIDYPVFTEIRSAHFSIKHRENRIFDSAEAINYGEIESGREKETTLTYFLQNIFRKSAFRVGQIPILNRALQHKNVIGLLPTGGGKSMTYQMAAILQPGFSLVVAPIKSLMTDQVANLKKNKIDACHFINSNLSTDKRKIANAKLSAGKILFSLISPERFQVAEFRELLTNMYENQRYFQYVVIDEAHCVSEWGHDFRTSYLMLGRNAQRFAKPKMGEICLFGLTATASFDVLADVQRELSTPTQTIGEEAVVRLETELSERLELSYEVLNIDYTPTGNYKADNPALGALKYGKIAQILRSTPQNLANLNVADRNAAQNIPNFNPANFGQRNENGKFDYAGLIFCSHKTGAFGVTNVAADITQRFGGLNIGTFMGGDEGAASEANQEKFINNESQLMIATKAFGMGIDKPNVRYTIHFNYPSSLESFVQEAGRAGRDRKWAKSYILFADNAIDKEILMYFYHTAFQGQDVEKAKIWKVWQPIETELQKNEPADRLTVPFSNIEEIKILFEANGIIFPIIGTKRDYETNELKSIQNYSQLEKDVLENDKDAFSNYLGWTNSVFQLAEKEYISQMQTEKALYRMLNIGAIDDYLIDYNAKIFTVFFSKKPDSFYREEIRKFLNRYYSIERSNIEIEKLDEQKGQNIIQKCFVFLIDFVYTETSQKRLRAIDDMREACLKYTNAANSEGEKEFKEFLFYYFNSKYARQNYQEEGSNQSLYDRTDKGRNERIDWVWEFIGCCNSKIDNLKHLRGATMVLLKTQPDNSTLLLLRAFATIVLEIKNKNNTLIKAAIKDLQKGFASIKKSTNSAQIYQQIVAQYNEALRNHVGASEEKRIQQIIAQINIFALLPALSQSFLTLSNDFSTLSKQLF